MPIMNNLKERYLNLVKPYEETDISSLWLEVENNYSQKSRHYHNLQHIDALINHLEPVAAKLDDWELIQFSVFYHDIIYKPTKSNNEEKSAELAVKRLTQLGVSTSRIEKCKQQIIATKEHKSNQSGDTAYLLDADLSILGAPVEQYLEYTKKIRKEYGIYPDLIYKPGRKKVVQHFLNMASIFKTKYFQDQFEKQAKKNLQQELDSL